MNPIGSSQSKLLLILALVSIAAAGCPKKQDVGSPVSSASDQVGQFFSDSMVSCTSNSGCVTGLCDLVPVYGLSLPSGICLGFPNAFDKWQRVLLARRVAKLARDDQEIMAELLVRIDGEISGRASLPMLEAMAILLAELGGSQAEARLEILARATDPAIARFSGLMLARLGNPAGINSVVEAAGSYIERSRIHAARAAGGLCDATSLGVLATLLEDPHPLVKQASAQALVRCRSPQARGLLEEAWQAEKEETGTLPFMFESALRMIQK